MILVDTSVWVDHLRANDAVLADLLGQRKILMHAFVMGEIALGNLRRRDDLLLELQDLPRAAIADDREVLHFIATRSLFGRGIGYVDAHLLAATLLQPGLSLWTRDRRLEGVAFELGIAAASA